jgi:hypothetical protein
MVPFIVDEESQASVRWEKVAYEAKVDYTRQRNEMILPSFACYQCLFAPAWRWRDSRAGGRSKIHFKGGNKKGPRDAALANTETQWMGTAWKAGPHFLGL